MGCSSQWRLPYYYNHEGLLIMQVLVLLWHGSSIFVQSVLRSPDGKCLLQYSDPVIVRDMHVSSTYCFPKWSLMKTGLHPRRMNTWWRLWGTMAIPIIKQQAMQWHQEPELAEETRWYAFHCRPVCTRCLRGHTMLTDSFEDLHQLQAISNTQTVALQAEGPDSRPWEVRSGLPGTVRLLFCVVHRPEQT